jgi:hypothetical protein
MDGNQPLGEPGDCIVPRHGHVIHFEHVLEHVLDHSILRPSLYLLQHDSTKHG